MGGNSGGASPYGPFLGLNQLALQNQAALLANQQAQSQAAGQTALGTYIQGGGQLGFGGFPGWNPATPAPGQPSQPAGPLMITPGGVTGPMPGFAGVPGGQPMPGQPPMPTLARPGSPTDVVLSAAGGAPAPQPVSLGGQPAASISSTGVTGGAAPSPMTEGGQPAPEQQGQPGAPGQQLIPLDKILQGIVKANPKASPRDIYQAAALYLPYMTEQDNALLRQALYTTRYDIGMGRITQSDVNNARTNATKLATTAANIKGRAADVAVRVQAEGDRTALMQVQGIQREIAAQEAIINNTSLLAAQNPDVADQQQKAAETRINELDAELRQIEANQRQGGQGGQGGPGGPGGPGGQNTPGAGGRKVKTQSIFSPTPMEQQTGQ